MSSTSSPFGQNEWLVEEMYRKFRDDPSSVDPSWHEFLLDYKPEATTPAAGAGNGQSAPTPAAAAPAAPPVPAAPQTQAKDEDVDALLDEIDDVLETNAEEFVKGFVQKGGE